MMQSYGCCARTKTLGEETSQICQNQDDEIVMIGGVELFLCREHARIAKHIFWRVQRGRYPYGYLPLWSYID